MLKIIVKLVPILVAVTVAGIVFCCSHKSGGEDLLLLEAEENTENDKISASGINENAENEKEEGIWVYVSGQVLFPGVYFLERGARMYQAIEMAGGFTESAAAEGINLASFLEDGQQINVADRQQMISGQLSIQSAEADDGRININTATAEELTTLPGIGKARASSIIEYRNEHPFLETEDIKNISGIKDSLYNQIKDLIKVN